MAAGKKMELCRRGKNNEKEGEKSLMSGQNMHLKRFKNPVLRSRSRSFLLEPEPKKNTFSAPAPAPAIIKKKHFHNQQIFSKYDNEFRFLFSTCSVH